MEKSLGVQVPLSAPKNNSFSSCSAFYKFARINNIIMKGKALILSVVLALLGFNAAIAEDEVDTARVAIRRSSSPVVVSNRQTSGGTSTVQTNSVVSSRSVGSSTGSTATSSRDRATVNRTNVVSRDTAGSRTSTETGGQTVSARTTSNVQTRTTSNQGLNLSSSRSGVSTARTASSIPRVTTSTAKAQTTGAISRSGTTVSRSGVSAPTASRTATTTAGTSTTRRDSINDSSRISRSAITAEEIMNRDYTKCREVYYSCMDEFCANKDSQLKRCACSARVNEFDAVKKQLTEVEDKLLDFNQRLLTVNMDKEDAEAIFKATEGELAFQQEDKTDSKKLLDEIAKKLNTTFDDSTFNQSLSPISLSLNIDSAFDSVDSLLGASTTTKTGTELYNAALPICREMALEVCTQDELDIIESGYLMVIEQDCNTVAKSYETQQDQAREKILEGSALLDMSRLDIYQKRNSDDILTCKKKMLDMLTDSSVCGENLEKCLDISGKYIDPSTGEAFLTVNLVELGSLITRPEANQTWTSAPGNSKFVSYLDSKKIFLESATENCQDIADYVWDDFIEDALAQIKLAQESKLEEVRQSCTTLTMQCLSDTMDSLEDFDARAISVFGVIADKTANEMCSDIKNACTALLDSTSSGEVWDQGMTEIATDKTYDAIMSTCREVGRSCIIQACKSISGNFGLCESIQTSVNRKAIINRTSCWDEVVQCVADATNESINNIFTEVDKDGMLDEDSNAFYSYLYGDKSVLNTGQPECISTNANCVYDICETECGLNKKTKKYTKKDTLNCKICRLAEKVWGNCEAHPATLLSASGGHNQIKTPQNNETTLLYWFAQNTGTESQSDNCRDTSCGPGLVAYFNNEQIICMSSDDITDDNQICGEDFPRITIDGFNNCCKNGNNPGKLDTFGNCCLLDETITNIQGVNWSATNGYWTNIPQSTAINNGLCLPNGATFVAAVNLDKSNYYKAGLYFIFCIGTVSGDNITDNYPSGQTIKCNGDYIMINKDTEQYITPPYDNQPGQYSYNENFYREKTTGKKCIETYKNNSWSWKTENGTRCSTQTPINYQISFEQP